MKDKDTVSPKPDAKVVDLAERNRQQIYERIIQRGNPPDVGALQSRIAELEKENAELNASEAGWFNSCTEYQKENDALIIENCALESRLQKANQYLEANGMEVRF